MNEKFCNTRGQEITFTDDGIIFSDELIPYGRMKDIKITKDLFPKVDIIDKKTVSTGQNLHHGYLYEADQKDSLEEMVKLAKALIKRAPSIEPPKAKRIQFIDSLDFKYKNRVIRFGKGFFATKIPVSLITTCEGMSYWEDAVFNKVRITFDVGNDRYVIQGRTFDAVKDIPFREYYNNMVKDSEMPAEEKEIALNSISYGNVELFANGARKQANEPVNNKEKDASVIGRAVVGAAIAGPTGAVVGALSAVDKNNKNKK